MEFINREGKPCSASHYLAEMMCLRKSKKQNIPINSGKFWNSPEWKKDYQRQIQVAHGLLKLYNPESIIAALTSKEGNWIFSLSFKGLPEIIKNNEIKVERQRVIEEYIPKVIEVKQEPAKEIAVPFRKKSKLEELE